MKHLFIIITSLFICLTLYGQDFDWCIQPNTPTEICIDIPADYSIIDVDVINNCQVSAITDSCFIFVITPGGGLQFYDVIIASCDDMNNCQTDSLLVYGHGDCGELDCDGISGEDCVWPGDTNNDGVADAADLLQLGLNNGLEGMYRESVSIDWIGQPSFNWSSSSWNSTNPKHIDCDGNGVVEIETDMNAIIQNYALTHAKTNATAADAPSLSVNLMDDLLDAGDSGEAQIELGSIAQPTGMSHGIAFSIFYDATLIENINVDWTNSWLGDVVGLSKHFPEDGRIDIGLTRTDGIGIIGQGEIASITFTTKADIIGNQVLTMETSVLDYVDEEGNYLLAIPQSTEILIASTISTQLIDIGYHLEIYPNPIKNICQLKWKDLKVLEASLFNINGQLMYEKEAIEQSNLLIDMTTFSNGLYLLHLVTDKGVIAHRLHKQ